ncbi:MAG: hypothetical protein Q9191_001464 [Dirinaria sp. TL-2023a]
MPEGRVYIINSPDLALSVQRCPTKISFWHVEALFTGRLAGLGPFAAKALAHNIDGNDGQPSYLREGMTNAHSAMKPGDSLTDVTRASLELLTPLIGELGHNNNSQIELGNWVTKVLMASITGGIFGPQSPYRDQQIADAFWYVFNLVIYSKSAVIMESRSFQDNAAGLMSLPFPRLFCSKSYTAREKLAVAFERYYAVRGYDSASRWVRGATKISDSYGISDKDKARIDISNSHATLANTIPAAFWTIYHIFSDPTLLDELRSALIPFLTIREQNDITAYELDISHIRNVPILRSVLSEVLRHYANGTGTRIVVEDIMLDNRYFLKQGSFVFMPNRSYHFNSSIWGPTVNVFDARRFMSFKPPSGSFRPFGGGANLCPGRFFAMNGILAISAMLALRYDISPATGDWVHPGIDDSNMTLLVHPSKAKTAVKIIPRQNSSNGNWTFKVS